MKDEKRNQKPAPPADDKARQRAAYRARQDKDAADWEKMRADGKARGLQDPY
jgi:hypothetical protein